jgi:hypothetical protein
MGEKTLFGMMFGLVGDPYLVSVQKSLKICEMNAWENGLWSGVGICLLGSNFNLLDSLVVTLDSARLSQSLELS